MTDPDRMPAAPHTFRRVAGRAFFAVVLCGVLYLALMPNTGHAKLWFLPMPVYRWLAAPEHDDFCNILAFAVLAGATFLNGLRPAGQKWAGAGAAFARRFAGRLPRLAALLVLVCLIEILQIWIPGRVSDLEDVCSGWSGIFAAWLFAELIASRGKSGGRGDAPERPVRP